MHAYAFSDCASFLTFQKKNNLSSNIYIINLSLVHTRKRNTHVNGTTISANYNQYEDKYIRPYFLIHPQPVLVLPNETGNIYSIKKKQ